MLHFVYFAAVSVLGTQQNQIPSRFLCFQA